MKAYQRLQRWWDRTSADVSVRPTPRQEVEQLEQRYDILLPDDFKEYLLMSCPDPEAVAWDAEEGIWWRFDQIRNIPEEYQHAVHEPSVAACADKYLFFADHCIWCWAWAIACTNDENRGKVVVIAGEGHDRFVASSFSDFVERYTTDWGSVQP